MDRDVGKLNGIDNKDIAQCLNVISRLALLNCGALQDNKPWPLIQPYNFSQVMSLEEYVGRHSSCLYGQALMGTHERVGMHGAL